MKIAHCFVHAGVESEYLKQFGEIHGYGLEIEQHVNFSKSFEVDLTVDELQGSYDFGLFHPPCYKWAKATPDKEKYPDLLDRARYLAKEYCDYWVVENVEYAPLKNPVYLDGFMFNKPIRYKRAFETNFKVPQPESLGKFKYDETINEITQFKAARIKGYTSSYYSAHDVCKNSVPSYYLEYLLSHCPIFNVESKLD